jgi:hypothetical protein
VISEAYWFISASTAATIRYRPNPTPSMNSES